MQFEHYVKFTNLLASSSVAEKAKYSFRLLDHQGKGYVEENDIALMMESLFEMWNILTSTKIYLLPEYIQRVMSILDANGDRRIELNEYIELYSSEDLVFPWWDWFNQGSCRTHPEEMFAQEALKRRMQSQQNLESKEILSSSIKEIKSQLESTSSLMKRIHEKANAMRQSQLQGEEMRLSGIHKAATSVSDLDASPTSPGGSFNLKRAVSEVQAANSPDSGLQGIELVSFPEPKFIEEEGGDTILTSIRESMIEAQDEMLQLDMNMRKINSMVEAFSKTVPEVEGRKLGHKSIQSAAMMSSHQRQQLQVSDPSKKYGLLFGHTNWGVVMALMVSIRAGLKM